MYTILRLDTNPQNQTYGKWTRMTDFQTLDMAQDFVRRASTAAQQLQIAENYTGYNDPRTHQGVRIE